MEMEVVVMFGGCRNRTYEDYVRDARKGDKFAQMMMRGFEIGEVVQALYMIREMDERDLAELAEGFLSLAESEEGDRKVADTLLKSISENVKKLKDRINTLVGK